MMIATLGIDLGKNSCSLAGLDEDGHVVLRRRMRPKTIVSFTRQLPTCTIAMEACCGAHHMGRLLAAQGHTIRLMSPEYVRPYTSGRNHRPMRAERAHCLDPMEVILSGRLSSLFQASQAASTTAS